MKVSDVIRRSTQQPRGFLMRYAIVIEQGATSYGAYIPDLPGCVAVAETLEEVRMLIQEAIEFYLEGLKSDGDALPQPRSICEYVEASFV